MSKNPDQGTVRPERSLPLCCCKFSPKNNCNNQGYHASILLAVTIYHHQSLRPLDELYHDIWAVDNSPGHHSHYVPITRHVCRPDCCMCTCIVSLSHRLMASIKTKAYMKIVAYIRICIACIRIRMMRLKSDGAYADAYGSLYIYVPSALERDQSTSLSSIQCNTNRPQSEKSLPGKS